MGREAAMERELRDKTITVVPGCPPQHWPPATGPTSIAHRLLRPVKMSLLSIRINGFRMADIMGNIPLPLSLPLPQRDPARATQSNNRSVFSTRN